MAEEIDAFFKQFEADPTVNLPLREKNGEEFIEVEGTMFARPVAFSNVKDSVTIYHRDSIFHEGKTVLPKADAWEFLQALRAGYKGRYYEWKYKVPYIDISEGWRHLCGIVHSQRKAVVDHTTAFYTIFHARLSDFMDKLTVGFDIVKFDEAIEVPEGISTKDHILAHYGQEGVDLILKLMKG
jgi:hypothetical protein